ncbi:MAG TPA: GAP family protein [Solirubrobacteraceae bacterium]|nr:GAP family protein [Solirubrobacteraceae bacterium]
MGQVLVFALTAALNPTLVAASTLMMLLPNPVRLMLGYLCGALLTSITLGIVIVYELQRSDVVSTTKRTLGPAATLTLGVIFLIAAFVLATGRDRHAAERRRARRAAKADKGPSMWQRELGKGSARIAFVVGALLSLPGASYLAGLTRLSKLRYSTAATVLTIVVFNLIMLALLEIPLIAFAIAPEWTPRAIERAKAWIGRHWRRFLVRFNTVIGALLVIKGLLQLLS